MRARAVSFTLALAALGACDESGFDNYRHDTPVVTLEPPSVYPAGYFGAPLAVASDEGADQDWLFSGGGLGTPVVSLPVRAASALRPELDAWYVCGGSTPCGDPQHVPSGVGIAALGGWNGATLCGLTGVYSTTIHMVQVRCHGTGAAGAAFTIVPPPGFEQSAFGVVLAAPRRRRASDPAPADIVFVQAGADPGYVFAARPGGLDNITPMDLVAHAAFGGAMSVGYSRPAGAPVDLFVAVGAPGMRAAYAFAGDPRSGRAMRRVGCVLRGSDSGFGGAVATGDVDGDGRDDLIVGSSPAGAPEGGTNRGTAVRVFLASDAPRDATCSETAWPEAATLRCASVGNSGVECAAGADDFGSALAAGDMDGDGRDEVLVGAPRADALGVTDSGAVWVFAGNAGGVLGAVNVLRASSPIEGALLGAAVGVAKVGAREEAFIAEPAQRDVRMYLCSGVGGDRSGAGGLNVQCR